MSAQDNHYIKSMALCDISLQTDDRNILHEREIAINDIIQDNYFKPSYKNALGPYHVILSLADAQKLVFQIYENNDTICEKSVIILSIRPFKSIIKDYFDICQSYFDAVKKLSPSQIETIDMARRAIHFEGAALLQERLCEKIIINDITAKRIFTLIYVLHYKK